jgi:hypothetical protein
MSVNLKHIIVILVTSIPVSIINFSAYLMGYKPSPSQAFFSILFIILWLIYGIFMGFKKIKCFTLFSTLYWSIGTLLFILSYFLQLDVIFIPVAIILAGPIYGLEYFLNISSDITLVILSIAITYGLSICGYLIGKNVNKTYKE